MNILITLVIAILPVYLIGFYVYKMDNEKESSKLLTKLFLFGMLSCIPAAVIEFIVEPLFGTIDKSNLSFLFIYVSLGIALVEELCKWFLVYRIGYNNKEFNQVYDALVYCVFVSLGFACFENIFYVFASKDILTGILRALTAIPGHASDAIIMGNYLGLAKMTSLNNNKNSVSKYLLLSILMPTLAHSIYDYCLFTEQLIFIIIFMIFLIFIYVYSIRKIKKLSRNNNVFNINNSTNNNNYVNISSINYCSNCGTKVNGNFCCNCGKKLK